ncbi:MAG: putative Metallophosphoesterase [Candidatus Thorarchaeota archaeon]|nr:MAG: putative Metallophosphoesterase [Candidatus Thorarchaeota archaeon]
MRIVVITDTHGRLHIVNNLVRELDADVVIHCGDIGLMSHKRVSKISNRELSLHIRHSSLDDAVRRNAFDLPRSEKIRIVLEHNLLGEFDRYLEGEETFVIPVYAVWGNHEDGFLLNQLLSGDLSIPNLNFLTAYSDIVLDDWIRLTGVGGNLVPPNLFTKQQPTHPKPQMSFLDWARLAEVLEHTHDNEQQLWMVTHVSPGKEPLLENFSLHLRPDFWFSGHMGAPLLQHYSLFTYLDDYEFYLRYQQQYQYYKALWDEKIGSNSSERNGFHEDEVELMRRWHGLLECPITPSEDAYLPDKVESRTSANYTKGTMFFNLPDAYYGGYLVIDTNPTDRSFEFQTYGQWTPPVQRK